MSLLVNRKSEQSSVFNNLVRLAAALFLLLSLQIEMAQA